jgi:hypothetical protein
VVREDDVGPPDPQREHELAQELLGGPVGVEAVPGGQQRPRRHARGVAGDGELPQQLAGGAAGLPHRRAQPLPVGGAVGRGRGRVRRRDTHGRG